MYKAYKRASSVEILAVVIIAVAVLAAVYFLVIRSKGGTEQVQSIVSLEKECRELCEEDNNIVRTVTSDRGFCSQGLAPNFCSKDCYNYVKCTLTDSSGRTCVVSKRTCVGAYCGDGICNGNETEETCPQDCSLVYLPDQTILGAEFNFTLNEINVTNTFNEGNTINPGDVVHITLPQGAVIYFANLTTSYSGKIRVDFGADGTYEAIIENGASNDSEPYDFSHLFNSNTISIKFDMGSQAEIKPYVLYYTPLEGTLQTSVYNLGLVDAEDYNLTLFNKRNQKLLEYTKGTLPVGTAGTIMLNTKYDAFNMGSILPLRLVVNSTQGDANYTNNEYRVYDISNCRIPEDRTWEIKDVEVCYGKDIDLKYPIVVKDGGALVLINSYLNGNSKTIQANQGGQILIASSFVSKAYITALEGSSLNIQKSILHNSELDVRTSKAVIRGNSIKTSQLSLSNHIVLKGNNIELDKDFDVGEKIKLVGNTFFGRRALNIVEPTVLLKNVFTNAYIPVKNYAVGTRFISNTWDHAYSFVYNYGEALFFGNSFSYDYKLGIHNTNKVYGRGNKADNVKILLYNLNTKQDFYGSFGDFGKVNKLLYYFNSSGEIKDAFFNNKGVSVVSVESNLTLKNVVDKSYYGLFARGSNITVSNSTFFGARGIYSTNSYINITNNTFHTNTSSYIFEVYLINNKNVTFYKNRFMSGPYKRMYGGVYISDEKGVNISNTNFTFSGGRSYKTYYGFYVLNSKAKINESNIVGVVYPLYSYNSTVEFSNNDVDQSIGLAITNSTINLTSNDMNVGWISVSNSSGSIKHNSVTVKDYKYYNNPIRLTSENNVDIEGNTLKGGSFLIMLVNSDISGSDIEAFFNSLSSKNTLLPDSNTKGLIASTSIIEIEIKDTNGNKIRPYPTTRILECDAGYISSPVKTWCGQAYYLDKDFNLIDVGDYTVNVTGAQVLNYWRHYNYTTLKVRFDSPKKIIAVLEENRCYPSTYKDWIVEKSDNCNVKNLGVVLLKNTTVHGNLTLENVNLYINCTSPCSLVNYGNLTLKGVKIHYADKDFKIESYGNITIEDSDITGLNYVRVSGVGNIKSSSFSNSDSGISAIGGNVNVVGNTFYSNYYGVLCSECSGVFDSNNFVNNVYGFVFDTPVTFNNNKMEGNVCLLDTKGDILPNDLGSNNVYDCNTLIKHTNVEKIISTHPEIQRMCEEACMNDTNKEFVNINGVCYFNSSDFASLSFNVEGTTVYCDQVLTCSLGDCYISRDSTDFGKACVEACLKDGGEPVTCGSLNSCGSDVWNFEEGESPTPTVCELNKIGPTFQTNQDNLEKCKASGYCCKLPEYNCIASWLQC